MPRNAWRYLTVLLFLLSTVSRVVAMPIAQYDSMSRQDELQHIDALIRGTVAGLEAQGGKQDADRVYKLFNDGDGAHQFALNLETYRHLDRESAADPNNKRPPYQVEVALWETLKQNHINVAPAFPMLINKDFKPSASTENK